MIKITGNVNCTERTFKKNAAIRAVKYCQREQKGCKKQGGYFSYTAEFSTQAEQDEFNEIRMRMYEVDNRY